jgi:pSer/pThr/pTyr-binding forkhead associated (FHA) protein
MIIRDQQVSRHHATLERTSLSLKITDHSSTNGTFIDGKRIAIPTLLNYTDNIVIGSVTMQVVFRRTGD